MFTDELGVCPEKEFAKDLENLCVKYESLFWYGISCAMFDKHPPDLQKTIQFVREEI